MRHPLSRVARLRLEVLEGREVPAGNVTASLVGGRLTITGDDQDNVIQSLLVTGTAVTVTPDGSTSVNGQTAGTAVTLPGAATSLTANLLGGNDSLAIDPNSDFVLTGAATFNLGSENNTLNLTTSGRITLGGLVVTSGPGSSTVTVSPGVGLGTVTGRALFSFGPGGLNNQVNLSNTSFPGPAGVRVTAGSGGSNLVTANNVTVARTFSLNTGRSLGFNQTFTNDTLGGLAMTGHDTSLVLSSSTINGNLSEIGVFSDTANLTNVTVTGNVTIRGAVGQGASLTTAGTFTARNVSVSSVNGNTRFQAGGTSATINGNLSVICREAPTLQFSTSALSEVKGNVAVGGSTFQTSVTVNGNFKADRNVTVTAAPNSKSTSISIGDTTPAAAIGGNLTVAAGNGPLGLTLTNLTVGGATRVTTGAGADTLTIDATTFQGAFTANTGRGDDTFAIAQRTGMPAPVTFNGRVLINAGLDNDTLRLGLSTGGANSRVVFSVPTSRLNGMAGFNTYFKSTSQVTGPADFLNWTNA
ncbi:MAG: hypothetical protein J2P46_02515 [Zavarzinella sp.]|nr:hypothetical protein [Zavarzinella sp.]